MQGIVEALIVIGFFEMRIEVNAFLSCLIKFSNVQFKNVKLKNVRAIYYLINLAA